MSKKIMGKGVHYLRRLNYKMKQNKTRKLSRVALSCVMVCVEDDKSVVF